MLGIVELAVALRHLELVPEVERGGGAVEARAEVRRRRRRAYANTRSPRRRLDRVRVGVDGHGRRAEARGRLGILQPVACDDADDA